MADANITVTIPQEAVSRVIDAMCDRFRYETSKEEDETRAQFALRRTKDSFLRNIKSIVKRYEMSKVVSEDLDLE